MKKLVLSLSIACLLLVPAFAQEDEPYNFRDVDINTSSPEGQLITQASESEDTAEKIQLLETFVEKFSDDYAVDWVRLQLQGHYLETQNFPKVVEHGQAILELSPKDIEILHNLTKGYQGTQDWAALLPHLLKIKPLADAEAAVENYEDADEEETATWKSQVEYAQGVLQYVEYSLYTSSLKITDPAAKIQYLETLRAQYPEGQYGSQALDPLTMAYRQAGNFAKMAETMALSLAKDPANEEYLYALAETSLGQQQLEQARMYGQNLVDVMATKEKPENVSDEDWMNRKDLFTAYGNFVLGKVSFSEAGDSDKNKFRESRKFLLQSVEPLKAQGGQTFGMLAYFLGICYVKLDIAGDNITQATRWMSTSAGIESPAQAGAKDILSKIQSSQ
jgi:hypothetical protein